MRLLVPSINPEYMPTVYVPDEWEIPRKNVEVKTELGQGSFGMVYEGKVFDVRGVAEMKCAIKTVNENSTDRWVLSMMTTYHPNKSYDITNIRTFQFLPLFF